MKKSSQKSYESKSGGQKLIEVGGRELVMMKNKGKDTALHLACMNENISLDIVAKLIEVGGRELVMISDQDRRTALHKACCNKNIPLDAITKLIRLGGRELLMMKNTYGDIALHTAYFSKYWNLSVAQFSTKFTLLVKEYISTNIGGEFGIGGLFNVARQEVQERIYEKWDEILPVLESITESLQEWQTPFLHAAIITRAPSRIIQDIITQLEYSVLNTDSLNRYPIQVAFEECLGWSEGLQEIIEATAAAQQQDSSIYTAAKYGLKWRHHMKKLAEANVNEMMINGYDGLTGLHLFMVAAMGDCHDLSAIYGIMRMSPDTSHMH